MKSVIALTIGLMAAGIATVYSDFSLTTQTAVQSYIFSVSAPSTFHMLLGSVALILVISFREHQEIIDRKRH